MTDEPEKVTPDSSEHTVEQTEVTSVESTSTDNQPETTPESQPESLVAKPSVATSGHRSRTFIAIVLPLLLAVGGAVAWWWSQKNDTKPVTPVVTQSNSKKKEEPAPADPLLAKFITPTTGEVWLSAPKKLPAQGYLQYDEEYTEYYEVGSRAGKTIILSSTATVTSVPYLYEKAANGQVSIIAYPNSNALPNDDDLRSLKDTVKPNITVDTTTHYDSLSPPASLAIDGNYAVTVSGNDVGSLIGTPAATDTTKYTDVKTYGQSKIRKRENAYVDTKLTSIGYDWVTPLHTSVVVGFEPLDTKLSKYQWQRGYTSVDDDIVPIARGCGGAYTAVTRSDALTDSDLQSVGRSQAGLTVYDFKDSNNPLVTKAYDEFKEFVAGTDDPNANISKEDFIKAHAVLAFKDKYNQWLVYSRYRLRPNGGCAKPVVYLYPTVPTIVGVKVGADVKVSEPHYNPATGWKALALPNGTLLTTSGLYDSLFWEGPGIGQYPSITSGTVVPSGQAVATIQSQLKQLGLNNKEIADFVQYWQPKLPNKPYVRLTWLTTAQMNQLAPLYITPKPDTLIRVFLDFSGLDAPISLPKQQLTTIPRTGFTVVEWGGLSPTKLY